MASDYRRAIVGSVADTFDRSIRPSGSVDPIDVARARRQHDAYVDVIERAGLDVHRVAADSRYPDCCFVEDPAVVAGADAVVCESAAPSRRGEGDAVAAALEAFARIHRMRAPATMDGGDVVRFGQRFFAGLSERTNAAGIASLESFVEASGYTVTAVPFRGVLHLKSACSRLCDDALLVDPTCVDTSVFTGIRIVEVPKRERYASNCLSLGDVVVVAAGFPETRRRIADTLGSGVDVGELDMSEFRKAGGSLTCLSILL